MSSNEYKSAVDNYFTAKYGQLDSTITKMVTKHKSKIEPANLLSLTYLYMAGCRDKVLDYADKNHKTVDHVIYSFALKYIRDAFCFGDAQINKESKRIFGKMYELDTLSPGSIDYVIEQTGYTTQQQDDVYTETFIDEFAETLDKQDGICFRVYYYDGIDNARDFAKHFDISLSSAYTTINGLKDKLKQYINKNKIH